ncbi:hypothetical protein SAMN06265374_2953 [Roseibium denhamense]|uniref:Uncharacterized protein n=1 Tax=Roseibium denhamense TaxID=76305 RepID=A0ABY1P7V0_9HYPH|nr:hypothetical protein SAMN06265374_2953 [Roseibium denhamense]
MKHFYGRYKGDGQIKTLREADHSWVITTRLESRKFNYRL